MWFEKKRAFALGIAFSGSAFGGDLAKPFHTLCVDLTCLAGIIYPIMVTRLVADVGFPWAMRTVAFLTGFLVVGPTSNSLSQLKLIISAHRSLHS